MVDYKALAAAVRALPQDATDEEIARTLSPILAKPVRRVLGHDFVAMDSADYEALVGAEAGSFVCYLVDVTLVLSPDGSEVAEIDTDGNQTRWRGERM
jgi:hypothetical protein